jgi:broad specificity phosphatase PhoE
MRIYFVRHGQTDMNANCIQEGLVVKYKGRAVGKDWNPVLFPEWLELTPEGHRQAKNAAELLAERAINPCIYSSPEKRARDTASYTANKFGVEAKIDERVNEFFRKHGKETEEDALNRINSFVNELTADGKEEAIVFSHEKILWMYFSGKIKDFPRRIQNCEIIETKAEGESLEIIARYAPKSS